jgi:hypothetical protein
MAFKICVHGGIYIARPEPFLKCKHKWRDDIKMDVENGG